MSLPEGVTDRCSHQYQFPIPIIKFLAFAFKLSSEFFHPPRANSLECRRGKAWRSCAVIGMDWARHYAWRQRSIDDCLKSQRAMTGLDWLWSTWWYKKRSRVVCKFRATMLVFHDMAICTATTSRDPRKRFRWRCYRTKLNVTLVAPSFHVIELPVLMPYPRAFWTIGGLVFNRLKTKHAVVSPTWSGLSISLSRNITVISSQTFRIMHSGLIYVPQTTERSYCIRNVFDMRLSGSRAKVKFLRHRSGTSRISLYKQPAYSRKFKLQRALFLICAWRWTLDSQVAYCTTSTNTLSPFYCISTLDSNYDCSWDSEREPRSARAVGRFWGCYHRRN